MIWILITWIRVLGCYKPSPLKQKSCLEIYERKLGTKEIWELSPNVIFSLPGSFFFDMVAPLDLEKLDTPGPME